VPGACGCGTADTDGDGDGTPNCNDDCPADSNKTAAGACGCGTADTDNDADGTPNCNDGCVNDPAKTSPGTCGCGTSDLDTDGDGTPNCNDNCPLDANKTEPQVCGCGVSEEDLDMNGAPDCQNACPGDPNKDLPGVCGCGTPDDDTDGDGTEDCIDPCPNDSTKTDPQVCGCNVAETDGDGDGTPNCNDGCPADVNKIAAGACGCGVADTDDDSDGTPNCNDGCINDPDKTSAGMCGCGVSDADADGDGTANCNDGCPADPGKQGPGTCGCGVSEVDTDGDGTRDCQEICDNDPNKTDPGACGCGVSDTDGDGDGTPNCSDGCPSDPNKTVTGICGCSVSDVDTDGDGSADCNDGCPSDSLKTAPGVCGCGNAETDSDGDGTPNCTDGCDNDANKIAPGTCGCGVSDVDSDGDGTVDCNDGCPNDSGKLTGGVCGCGISDADSDSDGYEDCVENCDNDAAKQDPGTCGCGVSDADTDGDGTEDCIDNCPNDSSKTDPLSCGCGNAETDTDSDGSADCVDGCPIDPAKTVAGICGCGVVEGTCCVPGADADGDNMDDCDEDGDGDPWTHRNIFNGMHAVQRNQFDGSPSCGEIDTLSELNSEASNGSIQEQKDQYSGWSWGDADDDICHADYGFAPNWSNCDSTWQVEWTGFIDLKVDGYHCFSITGGTDENCTAFTIANAPAPLMLGETQCYYFDAGAYPIRWFHAMDDGRSGVSMDIRYCEGGNSQCTPSATIPATKLRATDPCGSGCGDCDADGDGVVDCQDECPSDANAVAGECGCPSSPTAGGTACNDGLCVAATQCDGAGSCGAPADCAPVGGTCTFKTYSGMKSSGYWFCTDAKSWSGAQTVCQSASETDLVHIDDSAENDFIEANIVSDSWAGGNDSAVEGAWRWTDDGTQFWSGAAGGSVVGGNFEFWNAGEPNDSSNEDCQTVRNGDDGTWNDAQCGNTGDYVCEVARDLCPDDPKSSPGACGCAVPDDDTDGDGYEDCIETCDNDATKQDPGLCGCGTPDTDLDGDGEACNDGCPYNPNLTTACEPKRKKLTIQGAQVPSAETDFPVLVRIAADLDVAFYADPTGRDIYFADDAGAPLYFERESYDSGTGALLAWVKMDLTGADQDFYMYYGDGETSEKSTPAGVWGSAYQHVWHLGSDPTGTNVDSTGNGGDATGVNMESGDLVGGVIGSGVVFDGSSERLTYSNGLTGSGPSTISAWVSQTNDGDNNCIISFGTPGSNQVRYLFATHDSTSTIRVGFNPNAINTDDGIEGAGWKLVTWVWNAGNTEVYVDGTSAYGPVSHTGANTSGSGGRLGGNVLDNVFLDAILDEVHVSPVVRSAGWIAAEYGNQRSGSTFISVGAQEDVQSLSYDGFASGFDGWVYDGSGDYTMSFDGSEGPSPGSVRIEGDTSVPSTRNGLTKTVDISGWSASTLVLSFNYRATSSTTASTVTNARFILYDGDTDAQILSGAAAMGGILDTGWQGFGQDVASQVSSSGATSVRIYLYVNDAWASDHSELTWFDNVRLVATP